MITPRTAILAGAVAVAAAGCTPPTMYHWKGYDTRLYKHYKSPQDRESWVEGLRTAILEAETSGLKVPPGLYAEYGYALYEEARFPDAISYFRKEHEKWPESRPFMEKMIRNAERRAGGPQPATAGPAGALEGTR
jgi:hypothetical protein